MDKQNLEFNPKPLEQKIHEMICGLYGKQFIHKLVVTYDGEMYTLRLHVHDNVWCPMIIQMQTEDQNQFLEYICKELSSRQITRSDFVEVNLVDRNYI